jgi:uncharacterized protein (UPF0332 family)
LELEDYASAVSRSYYCIFHCLKSVLALDGVDLMKHSAVISYFRREYVKTGLFDIRFSDILGDAFNLRNASDYTDFYLVDAEAAAQQVEDSRYVLAKTKDFLIGRAVLGNGDALL